MLLEETGAARKELTSSPNHVFGVAIASYMWAKRRRYSAISYGEKIVHCQVPSTLMATLTRRPRIAEEIEERARGCCNEHDQVDKGLIKGWGCCVNWFLNLVCRWI